MNTLKKLTLCFVFVGACLYGQDPKLDFSSNTAASNLTAFMNAKLNYQTYAGDPNGHLAGSAGLSWAWDSSGLVVYACKTTGNTSTAVWVALAPSASPTFTGVPAAPTAGADTNTTQVATTAFVLGQRGSATPLANGVGAAGSSNKYAPIDHVHPITTRYRTSCIGFGDQSNASDMVDATLGPQGNLFKTPEAVTVIEVSFTANAGTPSLPIVQKNHWNGSSWAATDITSGVLVTGASGLESCAATGTACLSTVAKSGVTITTAGSANVLAAGDYFQTKTGSGFASSGAKSGTACISYTVN